MKRCPARQKEAKKMFTESRIRDKKIKYYIQKLVFTNLFFYGKVW